MKVAVPSSGCINGVLHWILCRNLKHRGCADEGEVVGLRKEEQGKKKKKSEAATPASSSPGIVARLMGLESLPVFPYPQPETICRTRSANSVEPWRGGTELLGEQRSGVDGSLLRKSQSFREVRSYLRKESEEFLVLSFEDYDESQTDFGSEECDAKEGRGERKKRSRNKSSVNSAEINGKQFSGSENGVKANEIVERSSSCRKKISFGQGEMEMECSSQNSSPVSVLDLPLDADGDCLTSPDSSISVCKVSMVKTEEEDSRKKVLLGVDDERKKSRKCGLVAQDLSDVWTKICRLGEDDLNNSKWVTAKTVKSEEAEEIGFVVGQDIFELLLKEAVFDMFY